jgi:hypothetical protein
MKKEDIKIGFIFIHQNGYWEVSTTGENDYWGCTSLRTGAFVSFSTDEILNTEGEVIKIYKS